MIRNSEDFSHHLSRESKAREKGPFQMLGRIKSSTGIDAISFSSGLPHPNKFAIRELSIKFPQLGCFKEENGTYAKEVNVTFNIKADPSEGLLNFSQSLQYGQCQGISELVGFIKEHIRRIHAPRYENWDIKMSNGNTSGLEYCLRLLVNYGDHVLTEKYTYPAAITAMRALGVQFVSVDMDSEGMLPESLEEIMRDWDISLGPRPHVLYTVPTGQNPTGSTLSLSRRKKLLALARKYDIIIVEDEPYYFLQMEDYNGSLNPAQQKCDGSTFLKSLVPSLLSLDTEGRVLRLDSFSKLIAPGTRLGYITGNSMFIDHITRIAEVCTESPSGICQSVLYAMLHNWGQEGFCAWLQELQYSYTVRRNAFLNVANKYLPNSVCIYHVPRAGLFLWVELNLNHYRFSDTKKSVSQIEMEIFLALVEKGVKTVCGQFFMANPERSTKIFFRFAYSIADFEDFEEGIKRFTSVINEHFNVESRVRICP
ncbi:aromatic aminotransferase [Schizosaccharomyces pombe]|uniref:Aromatic amino acid aminotransferase C1773.13 n=1 Tax=Schizosaccharomyces pombe (strain 972 / ATCC 24843) TaxID=284812 RepID=AATR2_SCHPO|nr:putative aromatic aminotransferase [Schizosaccharomyces pombe]O94570.1 RecName: Full=Aromatic amino acid aminotransferase C1773.13 [Schizosaccharomyces pombe 972h-]CAA21918.1 aromatic aminotransferase (predicted) [Schizosaccharomyces pombe]|eukprot:NP_595128.1 putative aromatic aminotransferase [Schizosaccharomyces pombe]